jgi:hypothetical protein
MIYGYACVSTAAQDETGQMCQLRAAGCEKVFREKIADGTADRPQLKAYLPPFLPCAVLRNVVLQRLHAGIAGSPNSSLGPGLPKPTNPPSTPGDQGDRATLTVNPLLAIEKATASSLYETPSAFSRD